MATAAIMVTGAAAAEPLLGLLTVWVLSDDVRLALA
jgi:hypothetical protein